MVEKSAPIEVLDPERFAALCRGDRTGRGADMMEFVTHFAWHTEKILRGAELL